MDGNMRMKNCKVLIMTGFLKWNKVKKIYNIIDIGCKGK